MEKAVPRRRKVLAICTALCPVPDLLPELMQCASCEECQGVSSVQVRCKITVVRLQMWRENIAAIPCTHQSELQLEGVFILHDLFMVHM